MSAPTPVTIVDLRDPLERRLEAIEQALEDLEAKLVVAVDTLNRLAALVRTDHYGVGARGILKEGDA